MIPAVALSFGEPSDGDTLGQRLADLAYVCASAFKNNSGTTK
jgi:hypothetical protein